MSNIKQVGPNLWTAPKDMGVTPRFRRTDHAMTHYPKGRSIVHDPLQQNDRTPLEVSGDETDALGEVFEHSSAGGHLGYLDMRVNSVTNRNMGFYMGLIFAFFWWAFDYFVIQEFTAIEVPHFLVPGVYGLCFALSVLTLFRRLATPVRFHKANQETNVWHKKVFSNDMTFVQPLTREESEESTSIRITRFRIQFLYDFMFHYYILKQ